jgi:hypothetical protein
MSNAKNVNNKKTSNVVTGKMSFIFVLTSYNNSEKYHFSIKLFCEQ